jgi:hypothetical protein
MSMVVVVRKTRLSFAGEKVGGVNSHKSIKPAVYHTLLEKHHPRLSGLRQPL